MKDQTSYFKKSKWIRAWQCTKCNAINKENEIYCHNCGQDLWNLDISISKNKNIKEVVVRKKLIGWEIRKE